MKNLFKIALSTAIILLIFSCTRKPENQFDLSKASILISPEIESPVKESATEILTEEIGKRTNLQLLLSEKWDNKTVIALALSTDKELFGSTVPLRVGIDLPETKKEGYRLLYSNENGKKIVKSRNVKTGLRYQGKVEIREGLKEGDQLITFGYNDLEEGQEVRY